jgi:hypothetical protein
MKISFEIDGRTFSSIAKPKMKHLRIGGKLMNYEEKIDREPAAMYEYIEEIYGYIKDTFPMIEDKDIDALPTDKFMKLVADIAQWANGGNENNQKKT